MSRHSVDITFGFTVDKQQCYDKNLSLNSKLKKTKLNVESKNLVIILNHSFAFVRFNYCPSCENKSELR